jgi:polysaccharide export outer membrane protein
MRLISRQFLLLIVLSSVLFSCGTRKKIVYLQDIEQKKSYNSIISYEPKLQPDDLLSIIVSAENPEVTIPFNLPNIQGNYGLNDNQNGKAYLIDNTGFIDFPVIGKIKIGGLTRTEANKKLVEAVSEYITKPSINLSILNFKISVLGEVYRPGSYVIQSERITLLEALSKAGDLTIYGKRNNLLVIREVEGKKTYSRVDITSANFLNSPFYYLAQNDVIVVEPNKTKINSSVIGPDVTALLSGLTVLLSLLAILRVKI